MVAWLVSFGTGLGFDLLAEGRQEMATLGAPGRERYRLPGTPRSSHARVAVTADFPRPAWEWVDDGAGRLQPSSLVERIRHSAPDCLVSRSVSPRLLLFHGV